MARWGETVPAQEDHAQEDIRGVGLREGSDAVVRGDGVMANVAAAVRDEVEVDFAGLDLIGSCE